MIVQPDLLCLGEGEIYFDVLVNVIGSLQTLLLEDTNFFPNILKSDQCSVEVGNRFCCVDLTGRK